MPINIISNTEDFSGADWNQNIGLTVTTNTEDPPAFANPLAGRADKIEDPNTGGQAQLVSNYLSIPADTSSWIASVYIRKDAVTNRFPGFVVQLNVDGVFGVSMNTQTGALVDLVVPADEGVVDVDANWWRVWIKVVNGGTSDAVRVLIVPARSDTNGGPDDGTLTGFITCWGINLTNTATLQDYEPNPDYPSGALNVFLMEPVIGSSTFAFP